MLHKPLITPACRRSNVVTPACKATCNLLVSESNKLIPRSRTCPRN